MNGRRWTRLAAAACLGALVPAVAAAQSFGVRAGASADPDQFYFGAHVLSGPIADHVRFRPNVEVGIGNDLTLVAINLEFVYQRALQSSRWSLLVGGGPAANVFLYDEGPGHGDDSDVGGGINLLIGVSHRGGFFTEMKVGLLDSPSIKFGVGFTFGR